MADLPHRDVEKVYSVADFVAKLRRLADALEQQQPFTIQVAGERFTMEGEELEFQLKWQRR